MSRIYLNEVLVVLLKIKLNDQHKTTKSILTEKENKEILPKLIELGYIGICDNKNYHFLDKYKFGIINNISKQIDNFLKNLNLSYEFSEFNKSLNDN